MKKVGKVMTKEQLIAGISYKLAEALSFIVETTPNITLGQPVQGYKSADTSYFKVLGEYAAGELYGKIELAVSEGPMGARPVSLKMSFGDEAPTPISIASPNDLLDAITAKHRVFVERSYNKSSAFALNEALKELEELPCPPEIHTKIMEIIQKLR
jgi:hypothetical protein